MVAILDLDGTLLNSKKRHISLLKNLLSDRGLNISVENFVDYKSAGLNTKSYLEHIGLPVEEAASISKDWVFHIEDDEYLALDTWYEDAASFLKLLKREGYVTVIVTARKRDDKVKSFVSNGLNLIDDIIVVKNGAEKESEIRKKYSIDSGKDILVGDTEIDYECAIKLDVYSFMLNRGFRSKKFWDDKKITSYSDLNEVWRKISENNY